jgi:rhs family protein (fragment)
VGVRNVEQFRRSYTWVIGNRLHATEDGLTGRRVRYDYDEFNNLLSAEYKQGNDVERIYRIPDRIGNLFETREKDDCKYGTGSRLTEDRDYFYHYDCEGNLVFKEFRTLDWRIRSAWRTEGTSEEGTRHNLPCLWCWLAL